MDAAVSFDGTWVKGGFTSLIGVVFVLSVDTGDVLNSMSYPNPARSVHLRKGRCNSDDEFEEWQMEHIASSDCDINFHGSSPAMETEGAKVLWNRSLEKHKIRYKWMVSNGDSKAFNAVEDTYGDHCKVINSDCVGHVQKRTGKHLLNLKAWTKGKLADGKPIGGHRRLSEEKMKQIQRYCGLAITQNTLTTANPEKDVNMAV